MTDAERIFCGVFPTGLSWADRTREEFGDYRQLAFLPFDTLILEYRKGCPKELRSYIESHASDVIARRGQQFQVSGSGQTITLGRMHANG